MIRTVRLITFKLFLGLRKQASRDLLGYLLDNMDYANRMVLDMAHYLRTSGLDRPALWKALKLLEDEQILRRASPPSWSLLIINPLMVYPKYPNPATRAWWNSPNPRVGGPEPSEIRSPWKAKEPLAPLPRKLTYKIRKPQEESCSLSITPAATTLSPL